MAATLIHIKSRMLLPRPARAGDPQEDPREALVQRLIEHQRYKAAAELLHERETVRSAQWHRPDGAWRRSPRAVRAGAGGGPVQPADGVPAVLERAKQRPRVVVPAEQLSIEVRIEQLLARLSETEACGFEELFGDTASRADLIVTFLALLEMIRLKLVRVFQTGAFGAIRVYKRARPADAPRPMATPPSPACPHRARVRKGCFRCPMT